MKPAIDRLEHWLDVLSAPFVYSGDAESVTQARIALAEVRTELGMRAVRIGKLYDQGEGFRQLVGLCSHSSVCEVGFWQAGNRRWFAQVKLMSGDELEPRSGETAEEAVRNAVEMIEQRETAAAEDG